MPPLPPALTVWQFSPLAAVPLVLLAACYLDAARRVRKRRTRAREVPRDTGWRRPARPWPATRTLAFVAGLGVIALATQGWPAAHDDTLLSAHMAQHLLLMMVAPPLLVLGRPVTLLLHATRNPWHGWVKRVVRSRAMTALTWPPGTVALYSAVVLCTHLTGLIAARGAAHDAEHGLYLLAGYLYFLPVAGAEPIRWRVRAFGRYLLLLAAMPADIVTGATLTLHGPLAGYSAASVRSGGLVMLAGSDLIMTALAVALAAAIVRDRARDARPDADLAAYNAYLTSLDGSGTFTRPSPR